MALLFCDSFDHYGESIANRKYDVANVDIVNRGRRGTSCAQFQFGRLLVRNIGSQTGIVAMAAFNITSTDYFSEQNRQLFLAIPNLVTSAAFLMGLGYQGISQMGLAVANDGSLHVIRGAALDLNQNNVNSQKVASSAAGAVKLNQWHHIAMKVTTSSCIVQVDGVEVINYSGTMIQVTMPSTFTQFYVHGGSFGAQSDGWGGFMDDLVVFNTDGTTNNDFIGDARVDYCKPNAPGFYSDSTIIGTNPAATRWQSVDDQTPDDAVTEIELEADNDRDLYEHEDLPYDSANVYAVQGVVYANKQDAGLAAVKHIQRVNSLDDEATKTNYPAGGEYSYYLSPFDESADGPWTLEKFNASQFGVKREAI